MKKLFTVGDRVNFYAFFVHGDSKGYVGRPGTVVSLEGSGMRVKVDGYGELSAHQKQCRRLIKRKRKLVELKPGEVVVDWERLEEAWDSALTFQYVSRKGSVFLKFANALGLEKP